MVLFETVSTPRVNKQPRVLLREVLVTGPPLLVLCEQFINCWTLNSAKVPTRIWITLYLVR